MNVHETNKNEVAWTSWMPALGYALAASTGLVLEIGVGHFSTPFLHEYCKAAGRRLVSFEDNDDWMGEFKDFNSETHELCVGTYDETTKKFDKMEVGVVFIDNSPGGEARLKPFKRFLPISKFVVVHDYHRENEEAIKPLLEGVNYKIFNDYEPPTLLASKSHKL